MRDEEVAALGVFLENLDRDLRAKFPKLFERVDRIKNAPGWAAHREGKFGNRPYSSTSARLIECLWCGDNFTAIQKREKYCSLGCSHEMRRFQNRRKR